MVVMGTIVAMIMASMVVISMGVISMVMSTMRVAMAMVCMAEGRHTHNVNNQSETADGEQLSDLVDAIAFCETLNGLVDNLNAYEPKT